MASARPIDRKTLAGSTLGAAKAILGARLVRSTAEPGTTPRVGRIVEVEAYVGRADLASHAHGGMTRRNTVMFGQAGRAYVYLVYGMYHCLNVVTEADGIPAALLVRAVEPLFGVEEMRRARIGAEMARATKRLRGADSAEQAPTTRSERASSRLASLPTSELAAGPGLVCAAFSIDRSDNGADLCDPASGLRLEPAIDDAPFEVAAGPRVGVDYAPEPWLSRPWRFWIAGHPSVSRAGRTATRRATEPQDPSDRTKSGGADGAA